MADVKATLNKEGQLVSQTTDKPPILVASNKMVPNLNAQKLGGVEENLMLRTNTNRTLTAEMEVGANGSIKVSGGKIKIGEFELKQTNGMFHIDVVE